MTAFNLETSFLADWELLDWIETGDYEPPADGEETEGVESLKVLRFDATDAQIQSVAIGLGLTETDTVLLVWNPEDETEVGSLQPRRGGRIVLGDATWVIRNFRLSRFGYFEMGVNEATSNADA